MSLHGGVDTTAFVSTGVYTETYGLGEQANLNSLFTSLGFLETAGGLKPGDKLWGLLHLRPEPRTG